MKYKEALAFMEKRAGGSHWLLPGEEYAPRVKRPVEVAPKTGRGAQAAKPPATAVPGEAMAAGQSDIARRYADESAELEVKRSQKPNALSGIHKNLYENLEKDSRGVLNNYLGSRLPTNNKQKKFNEIYEEDGGYDLNPMKWDWGELWSFDPDKIIPRDTHLIPRTGRASLDPTEYDWRKLFDGQVVPADRASRAELVSAEQTDVVNRYRMNRDKEALAHKHEFLKAPFVTPASLDDSAAAYHGPLAADDQSLRNAVIAKWIDRAEELNPNGGVAASIRKAMRSARQFTQPAAMAGQGSAKAFREKLVNMRNPENKSWAQFLMYDPNVKVLRDYLKSTYRMSEADIDEYIREQLLFTQNQAPGEQTEMQA